MPTQISMMRGVVHFMMLSCKNGVEFRNFDRIGQKVNA